MTTADKLQSIMDTKAYLKNGIGELLETSGLAPMPDGVPFKDYPTWLEHAKNPWEAVKLQGALFGADEPGIWLAPSPTTTFTDTAGTTPAGVGDAVARVNDLSGNGNHATQTTAAARPILARVPATGRRNLLTYTEQFDNAAWVKANVTVTANTETAPDGTTTADKIVATTSNDTHTARRNLSFLEGLGLYTVSAYFKEGEYRYAWISDSAYSRFRVAFDMQALTVTQSVGSSTVSFVSASIIDVGNGWRRCTAVLERIDAGNVGLGFSTAPVPTSVASNGPYFVGDGVSGGFIWGAKLKEGAADDDYQRVGSTYDVTEAGQPDNWYLSFDGVDDLMVTPSIDLTGTDKMTAFIGLNKLSDSNRGVAYSFGSAFTRGHRLEAPGASLNNYESIYSGAISGVFITTFKPAPSTDVLSFTMDLSAPIISGRINGVAFSSSASPTGGGTFSNGPIHIGRRFDGILPFNGHIYSLIIRGALTEGADLTRTEAYIANRTAGVAL